MANAAGFIQESIWRDQHWRKLSRSAQALYLQLLSQKELDCAGIIPLQPNKWAKGCDSMTAEQVWADLNELQDHRFVYFDTDTDELLVRTYMRNSNVARVPNMRKSASRSAALVASDIIKPILAVELRATGDPSCVAVADKINPSGRVTRTLPEPLREPLREGLPEPLREPFSEPTGVGKGLGVSHFGTNSGGVASRPICAKHRSGNPNDEPCRQCKRVREWDETHAAAIAADELEAKRRTRYLADNCPDCQGTNLIEVGDNIARKCHHQQREEINA